MSILTLGGKKEKKENSPIKEWEKAKKKKRRKISNQRESKKRRGKEISNQRERKKKRKKIPNQRMGESKKRKERKFLIKETRRNMQRGLWTGQYLNNTELSPNETKKKGNHDLKWSSPFNYQPKSRALAILFSRPALNKKNSKRKSQENQKPKTHKSRKKKPPKEPIPKGSPIDP